MPRRRAVPAWLLAVALALFAGPATLLSGAPVASGVAPAAPRPNIVLILTDDMRADDLAWMPLSRALFERYGTTFTQGIAPHPLCCPARAQLLTGQYAQNNGVLTNQGPFGGFAALTDPANHVGTWLQAAGYHTAFVGKYLNGYSWEVDGRQPGWDFWDPTIEDVYSYTHFTQANDGEPLTVPDGYITDYVRDASVRLVHEYAAEPQPFFLWAAYVAPHLPARPAPRHAGLYQDVPAPSLSAPSFNKAILGDTPSGVNHDRVRRAKMQRLFTRRIETLASVDEAVAATFAALAETNVLDHTLVVLTSDNGFLLGEHRQFGKSLAFEESLRVPMAVAGPGTVPGTTQKRPVSLVDVAPTFVAAAGATAGRVMDGASFLGGVDQGGTAARTLLVQDGNNSAVQASDRRWTYRGIRTARYTFVRWWTGELELYDRRVDPAQLRNRWHRPAYAPVVRWARQLTRTLERCAGEECLAPGPAPPAPPRRSARRVE